MKSYGNLILRLSKQIWHQTFCPAQAGDEADTFTVTLKWNTQDSQITVFVEEYMINGLPLHAFPSQKWIALGFVHLSTQLNVYLDIEGHILTWGQWQTLLGWGKEKLVSWTTAKLLLMQVGGRDVLFPAVWMGLEEKKKKRKRKHNKRSSASCSKPKPKHLQAGKAIPASPYSKEEQQDAHRRAPMFHSHIVAPREMQFGLKQCGTVWRSYPHALVTAVLCHTSMRFFQSCTYISGSESRKQQEMLQEANYKEIPLQTAAVAYQ